MTFQNEDKLLDKIKQEVDRRPPFQNFAVLDADGTLWQQDINEILLNYQHKKGLRDFKDLLNPIYQKQENRSQLCKLFAQKQAGFRLKEFKEQCAEALKNQPLDVFPFQKNLLAYLRRKKMKIVILTASLKWLVEVAVKLYKIPVHQVLGVELVVEKRKISPYLLHPCPPLDGKRKVFLNYSQGEQCFLAGGNTPADSPLLEMAKVAFAVQSTSKGDSFFIAEEILKYRALKNGWIVFQKK